MDRLRPPGRRELDDLTAPLGVMLQQERLDVRLHFVLAALAWKHHHEGATLAIHNRLQDGQGRVAGTGATGYPTLWKN